mgnify:CR=1 FL=1
MLQAASLSFDAAAWELWGPLAAGAASVAVEREAVDVWAVERSTDSLFPTISSWA